MVQPVWYSVEEAAARMGVSRQRVGQMVKDEKLRTWPPGDDLPVQGVAADEVDGVRAKKLSKFSDVVDTTGMAENAVDRLAQAEARARSAESWLRISVASDELLKAGIHQIEASRQLVVDALLAALPDDGRQPDPSGDAPLAGGAPEGLPSGSG